ncbi:helix-turn-helix domain-containing protein [Leptospira santarosai]|uniref:AraC family transcriptional regulator n=1 Tax=Leptospira santarosai TaxID=28183 RepID=UPI0024AF6D32|nr:helix-turn-helix domain-containing protein [Leptospira santarosai]MDI7237162.1 helix-turn-helix domain-containing protein [Leptospira santarosai]
MYEQQKTINPFFTLEKNEFPILEIIIISLHFILIDVSYGLWDLVISNLDKHYRLIFVSILFGIQLFPFLLLRPIIKSKLKIGSQFSISKNILIIAVSIPVFLVLFQDALSLALYGSICIFLLSLFLAVETFFLVKKHRLSFRFYWISLIPISMALICIGNVAFILKYNSDFNDYPFVSNGINLFIVSLLYFRRYNFRLFELSNSTGDNDLLRKSSLADIETKIDLFIKEKRYLDIKFNYMSEFSKYLEIPSYHASLYINKYRGRSYREFINQLRIEEVILNLSNNFQSRNIIKIAFASGFSSYSAFIRSFKKNIGITPSQYIVQNNLKIDPDLRFIHEMKDED